MSAALIAALAAAVLSQNTTPLKKSDLIRLLSTTALAPAEIADLVQRRCVSFTPSARDKADLRALGATDELIRRVDACVRRGPPPRGSARLREAVVAPAVRPGPQMASSARTGFVSGVGQRGRVGTRLSLPLVFEVRDSANRPLAGRAVVFTTENARLESADAITDSLGRVRSFVTLGNRAGAASVSASVGRTIERQAALVAVAGPPALAQLRCGTQTTGPIALLAGAEHELTIVVTDALGNEVDVTDLRVTPSDDKVVRVVTRLDAEHLVVRAGRTGTTAVTVDASGVRGTVSVTVDRGAGATSTCRRNAPRG